jgi:hypothetical protein
MRRTWHRIAFAVLGCVVLAGCGASGANESPRASRRSDRIAFERMPANDHATCRRSSAVRAACPTIVPAPPRGGREVAFARVIWSGHVFELGIGAEHLGHPEFDRPPRFVHLVVAGGDLTRLFPFRLPSRQAVARIRNGLRWRPRATAMSFGRVRWRCRGTLVLAPSPSMGGGIVGDHLIYWWRSGRRAYAVTLHAWEPFRETFAVLKRIVRSIPTSRC